MNHDKRLRERVGRSGSLAYLLTLAANIVDVTRPVRLSQVRVGVPISSEHKVRIASVR